MHYISRLGPVGLFILVGFLFGILGVACIGASEERDLSHDAGNDRSSRLTRARTAGTVSTSHGSSRTSGDHEAAAGGHETASTGHEAASAKHGTADTGHEAASAEHGTADTGHETTSAEHGTAGAEHKTAGAHAVAGESAHAADESADSHQAVSSQGDSGHGAASPSQKHDAPHWEYGGGPGQRLWGELAADFTACVDGSAQSPINVANAIPTPLRNVDFNYQPAQLSIVNNGHTIQGSYGKRDQGDGGSMTVDGTEYRLLQFHFHWPSEHMVDGKQYLMELHLVHQNEHGGLGVVGVLLERGEYNRGLEPFWANLPVASGSTKDPNMFFDINTVLPADQQTFRYPGSLTTPPCSEEVKWLLLQTPVEIAPSQAEMFRSIIGYNARYVQPMHGREVLEDSSVD